MEEEISLKKYSSKLLDEWPKISQFHRKLEPEIKKVSEITCLPEDTNVLLLLYFGGDSQKLETQYFNDQELYLKKAGLPTKDQIKPKPKTAQECTWCMMECEPEDGECYDCGHMNCRECWTEYLFQKFRSRDPFPKCLDENCQLKMQTNFLNKLLENSKEMPKEQKEIIKETQKTALCKMLMTLQKKVKPCHYGDCEYVYQPVFTMYEQLIYDLQCPRGHEFCYSCDYEAHRPLPCSEVKKWDDKAGDGSMLDAFMKDNPEYFRCPKCNRVINYVSGCDQMKCGGQAGHNDLVKGQGCGHVFCWRCFEPWEQHNRGWSGCNKFKAKAETDKDFDNKKYMHYLQGYEDNRVMKMDRAKVLVEKIQNKDLTDNYITEFDKIEVSSTQYAAIVDAIYFLVQARRSLKWTYVYGYYRIKDNQRELFEYQQGLFEEGLIQLQTLLNDDLSKLFKDESLQTYEKQHKFYNKLKTDITNQKVSTESFRENLLTHLEELELGEAECKKIKDQQKFEKNKFNGVGNINQHNDNSDYDDYDDNQDEDDDEYNYDDEDEEEE